MFSRTNHAAAGRAADGRALPAPRRTGNAGRALAVAASLGLAACSAPVPGATEAGVEPVFTYAVTSNETPYSVCLGTLRQVTHTATGTPINALPTFAVGDVTDKTGQYEEDGLGRPLTQGVTDMLYSALNRTGKVRVVERADLRVPLAELSLLERNLLLGRNPAEVRLRASDFLILGALTELNYNIVSGGIGLEIAGVGANTRVAVVNVALDLRLVDMRTFEVPYAISLQKQIKGTEVEANVFRFFGDTLVGFEAGGFRNEPLQLGVRSVVEMAVYQLMTDFLGLPVAAECTLSDPGYYRETLTARTEEDT